MASDDRMPATKSIALLSIGDFQGWIVIIMRGAPATPNAAGLLAPEGFTDVGGVHGAGSSTHATAAPFAACPVAAGAPLRAGSRRRPRQTNRGDIR
jgi:hypothetical protein